MANPIEYIVYEPDQVLTNDNLNETFNYLDQQNRWTRNKLIGIGIVCGLDVVINPGVIGVTKGCGVTSQGYLITQDAAQYTYYLPYAAVDVPQDLPFTYPYGDLPFYKPFCTGKNIWLMLTDDQYNALESAQQLTANTISSATATFLSDYAVVLFLEANEMDLKNCTMQDCNNKGEKMAFTARPLLVAKKDLPSTQTQPANGVAAPPVNQVLPHQIEFKRYNVPYADLNNTDDVLNAFIQLVDDTTLTQLTNAYNYCYQTYSSILKVSTNPFTGMLALLQKYRSEVQANVPVFIEYFYDLIDDLIKAYYEFSMRVSGVISTCCPDENLFPLHLVLGGASTATSSFVQDNYRTYFIYSPLFSKMGSQSAEIILLFNRMVIMLNQFGNNLTLATAFERLDFIQITPSRYEFAPLSERAIPYYYNVDVSGSELYQAWSYYKTSRGNAAFNLSYNANAYSRNSAVIHPLLYDIEHYNFFRVEGHIGIKYQTVLANILNQRLTYNLPFDVVAISADLLSANATLPPCNFLDLETDYKLILSEAACKIHTIFCFVSKLPYKTATFTGAQTGLFDIPKTGALKFTAFRLQTAVMEEPVLSLYKAYQKGDFMRNYCPPLENTIGSAYLASLKSGVFTNPVQIDQGNSVSGVYFYLFEFIDAVEELMFVLQTNTVADIDMTAFGLTYQKYLRYVGRTIEILTLLEAKTVSGAADANYLTLVEATEIDLLIEELTLLTTMCIDERLQVLKTEYTRRLTQYQQQHTFLNYYKNHPGLEHKAGVPKGGTLVLVYHSTQATISTGTTDTGVGVFTHNPISVDNPASVYLDDKTINLLKSFVNDCTDAPPAKKQKIIDILWNRPPAQQKYEIADGAVIADFYIPYLCCSDCPPTAYILSTDTTTPPAQQKPTIKMATSFCDNDPKPATIAVSAPGGTFNTVPGLDGTKLTFTPQTAGAGTYNIIYTLNGVASDPVKVIVLPAPANTFTFITAFNDNVLQATFTPDSQDSNYTYQWTFGQGFSPQTSSDEKPTVNIQAVPGGVINTFASLQIFNGACKKETITQDFSLNTDGLTPRDESSGGIISGIENLFKKKKK